MKQTVFIKSKDNELIKNIAKLNTSSKYRIQSGLFLLEGMRLCSDALGNKIFFEKVIFTQDFREKNQDILKRFIDNSDESFEITDSLFKKISDTVAPQGIIAVCKIPLDTGASVKSGGKYIALENISDPSNLGAICRSAEALGIDGIIVSGDSVDPYSPKVLRASMGTVLRLPVIIKSDFLEFIKNLSHKKFACVVDRNAKSINECDFADGSVCLIGNEGSGLTESAVKLCDYSVTIPMSGRVESLNASVAAAIVMWEMVK